MGDIRPKPSGCADSGCLIQKPRKGSMVTNGGCRCIKNMVKMQEYIQYSEATIEKLAALIKDYFDYQRARPVPHRARNTKAEILALIQAKE